MIVRRIRNEEVKRVQELMALAFEWSMDNAKSAQEISEQALRSPESREDMQPGCHWAAFMDDDSTMMGSFASIPYTVRFDGHEVGMFGIGGVNTLPMYRRSGCIRACFEKALPAMADDGAVFSYLYPFSTVYYGKFGYGLGCPRKTLKLRLEAIPKWDMGGHSILAEASDPRIADFKAVYDVWASRYNMMTLDELDVDYHWLRVAAPFKSMEYTYLYYGESGAPKGYMSLKPQNAAGRELLCTRFHFADLEGFRGLLSLLRGFASDHPSAIIPLPADIDWQPLIPEHSLGMVEESASYGSMARVVNVEKALKLAKPRGTGSLVIEVADGQLAINNGRFEARYEDGRMLDVTRTNSEPDVSLRINEFSSLILGRYDVSAIANMEHARIACEPDRAAALFYPKPLYITRPF